MNLPFIVHRGSHMNRNFGVTGSTAVGCNQPSSPHYRANANTSCPDPISLSAGLPLKRGKFAQALIDILALAFIAFFICATAISIPLCLFILVFVSA